MQRPQGSGYPSQGNYQNRPQGYPNQQGYPNLQGYPYQGDSMNPSPNYNQPQYPNQNYQNRPGPGGYPNLNAFPYEGDSSDRYPNYNNQQPTYPNQPDDGAMMYPDEIGRPYQNGGMPPNQGGPGQPFQYPQNNQYPPQGNFQGHGNPNEMNTNYRPDDLGNLPDTSIHFPDQRYPYQPNQYYLGNHSPNQNFRPVQGQPGNYPNNYYPSNNYPNTNMQYPTNYPGGANTYPSAVQYPNQGIPNPGGPGNVLPGQSVSPGFNNVFQNPPPASPLPNNPETIPDDSDTAAILGKPVIVPPATTLPVQTVLDNR